MKIRINGNDVELDQRQQFEWKGRRAKEINLSEA